MRTLLRHRRRISRSAGGNFLVALFLLLLGAFMLLPIYYTVVNSLKPIHELFLFPPRLYVTSPTLDNFRGLIRIQGQAPVPDRGGHRRLHAGRLHGGLSAGEA